MYSKNPQDWFFDILDEDEDLRSLALSESPSMLDDQLGAHNLPLPIKKLLSSAGVYTEAELMESVFEIHSDASTPDLIKTLTDMGFQKTYYK